jgi:hypothetical protein
MFGLRSRVRTYRLILTQDLRSNEELLDGENPITKTRNQENTKLRKEQTSASEAEELAASPNTFSGDVNVSVP